MKDSIWISTVDEMLAHLDQKGYGKRWIICDRNTVKHCLPNWPNQLTYDGVYVIRAGEKAKQLSHIEEVSRWMMDQGVKRHDVLLTLGGGVVSDFGGLLACLYKRGMNLVHVPTTLLGMIDAAWGGKTAVNLGSIKNQLGSYYPADGVWVQTTFLATLPSLEWSNGCAELLKYALLTDLDWWNEVSTGMVDLDSDRLYDWIKRSVEIKMSFVIKDPYDIKERRALNYGHTIGHGLEAMPDLVDGHGHAVAWGMVCEAYLSCQRRWLSQEQYLQIAKAIAGHFRLIDLDHIDVQEFYRFLLQDKKYTGTSLTWVAIGPIGHWQLAQGLTINDLQQCFDQVQRLNEQISTFDD